MQNKFQQYHVLVFMGQFLRLLGFRLFVAGAAQRFRAAVCIVKHRQVVFGELFVAALAIQDYSGVLAFVVVIFLLLLSVLGLFCSLSCLIVAIHDGLGSVEMLVAYPAAEWSLVEALVMHSAQRDAACVLDSGSRGRGARLGFGHLAEERCLGH